MHKLSLSSKNVRLGPLAGALLVFFLFIAFGEMFLSHQGSELKNKQRKVGVSIGYAVHSETTGDLDDMLKMADKRMYEDKSLRK